MVTNSCRGGQVCAWPLNFGLFANYARLFHIFVSKFSAFTFLRTLPEKWSNSSDSNTQAYSSGDDLDECLYYLRTLSNMLRWSSDSMWAALAENSIFTDMSHPDLYRISKHLTQRFWKSNTANKGSWPRRGNHASRVLLARLLARPCWQS